MSDKLTDEQVREVLERLDTEKGMRWLAKIFDEAKVGAFEDADIIADALRLLAETTVRAERAETELEKSNKLYFNDQKHFEKKVTENKKLKDLLRECRDVIRDKVKHQFGCTNETHLWCNCLRGKIIGKITATLEEKP